MPPAPPRDSLPVRRHHVAPDPADDWASWLRLQQTPGIGLRTQHRLLTAWGSPEQALQASPEQWSEVLGSAQGARLLDAARRLDLAEPIARARQWLARPPPQVAHSVLSWDHPGYPAPLLDLDDPPPLLWVAHPASAPVTDWAALWPRCVAVVGSRNPTAQGALTARQLAQALSAQGRCIVSGLAMGIDAAAHRGALDTPDAAMVTLGVLGTGIDQIYPRVHRDLALAVARRGLLVTELPPGTPPLAHHFPRRNRLIAALCPGTLVVEAALASGSLITARLAADLGREVMAVPGSIHMPTSRGCHMLLRDGAALIETAEDVLAALPPLPVGLTRPVPLTPAPAAISPAVPGAGREPTGSAPECLLQALGTEPSGLDTLCQRSGLAAPALQAALLDLELAGQAAQVPGGRWVRLYHLGAAAAAGCKPEDSGKHPPD